MRHAAHLSVLVAVLFTSVAGAQSTGTYALSNMYFRITGENGALTAVRFDPAGSGDWGSNAGGMHFALDGTALTSTTATWTVTSTKLTIGNLPLGATVEYGFSGAGLTAKVSFSGTRTVRLDWDLVYVDAGFYNRATGMNYSPDQAVDMPFESFYNAQNGNFRAVEMFKRTYGTSESGSSRDVSWPATHCRGRAGGDVRITGGLPLERFDTAPERLTLRHEGSMASSASLTFTTQPKDYGVTLTDGRKLPEFYVLPKQQVPSLHDGGVTQDLDDLLTEFFHHMTFWWAHQGHSGGIWADWGMMAGAFMDTPFRDSVRGTIPGWVIGDDGYGNPGYAYTWGSEIGWPFPSGRDTRHFNTNAIFITALWRYVLWTGDTDFLLQAGPDRAIRIGYSSGTTVTTPAPWPTPVQLPADGTLGQTFTADAPFTSVAACTPTWTTTNSGCTFTLYDGIGGAQVLRQTFSNVGDNAWPALTAPSPLPAGTYYLEMSNRVGTIGWWTTTGDALEGGDAVTGGTAASSLMERARVLMHYQMQTLLADENHQLITGTNVGTSDHLGRDGDLGSNYYDILPFGYHDALTDIHFYQSLRGMADLEAWVGNTAAAEDYRARLALAREAFNETYWREGLDREGHGRYIGCVDVTGADHDYGYSFINTMALAAGLGQDHPDRAVAAYQWLDHGESYHGPHNPAKAVGIEYADGTQVFDPPVEDPDHVPVRLTGTLEQPVFAEKPFTSIATHNPTWDTANSAFTLTLLRGGTGEVIASKRFTNVADNSVNTMAAGLQPAGYYVVRMSEPSGTIGWWASPWAHDIYGRWGFAPRVSNLNNPDWWQAAVGGDPTSASFSYVWDRQLQNGGADLYESGFDIQARARYLGGDDAWERLLWILRRYLDPDRLSGNQGFYGEGIQGGSLGGGSVGWVWSEFPETSVLGAAFFNGFFGVDPTPDGLRIRPRIPGGYPVTALGARHISYMGARFDLEATASAVRVTCTDNPDNTTFYTTGGLSGTGTFTLEVPLAYGSMYLSTKPVAAEGEGEGEGEVLFHSADTNRDNAIDTSELLAVIQLYHAGSYHCTPAGGYAPGPGDQTCAPHDSDYAGGPDWSVGLGELLRAVQFHQAGVCRYCGESEDGFCLFSSE